MMYKYKAVTIGITLALLVVHSRCQSTPSSDNEPSDDPCAPYNPPVPDFSVTGRRLSITKCYEYIWEIKLRADKAKRAAACYKRYVLARSKRGLMDVVGEIILNMTHVLGGRDAKPSEFPHMGAVGWQSVEGKGIWSFRCGCTLISNKFALTAAHCTKGPQYDLSVTNPRPKIVRFGVEDLQKTDENRRPIDIRIKRSIVHPQYASPQKYFDLALFELDQEITFSRFVQPACLWTGGTEGLKETIVTGWGYTAENSRKGSPVLQVANLDTIDSQTCDLLLKPNRSRFWSGLQDHQLCAGQLNGGVDACQGDSGGPLQRKIPLPAEVEDSMYHVVGVTAFGFGCGREDKPGVYTKVSHFLDWIESVVWH